MEITIEKGIPIPGISTKSCGRKRVYPLHTMSIGESFEVGESQEHSVRCAIAAFKKTKAGVGKDFKTRKTESGGRRVWRTA